MIDHDVTYHPPRDWEEMSPGVSVVHGVLLKNIRKYASVAHTRDGIPGDADTSILDESVTTYHGRVKALMYGIQESLRSHSFKQRVTLEGIGGYVVYSGVFGGGELEVVLFWRDVLDGYYQTVDLTQDFKVYRRPQWL